MSNITELATGQINITDTIKIELVEPSNNPSAVLIRWPEQPSVIDPRRFTFTADIAARLFAAAAVRLAQIRRDRQL
jgi:hypothetical protein